MTYKRSNVGCARESHRSFILLVVLPHISVEESCACETLATKTNPDQVIILKVLLSHFYI